MHPFNTVVGGHVVKHAWGSESRELYLTDMIAAILGLECMWGSRVTVEIVS